MGRLQADHFIEHRRQARSIQQRLQRDRSAQVQHIPTLLNLIQPQGLQINHRKRLLPLAHSRDQRRSTAQGQCDRLRTVQQPQSLLNRLGTLVLNDHARPFSFLLTRK